MKFSKIVAAISVLVGGGVASAQGVQQDTNVRDDGGDVDVSTQVDIDEGQQDLQIREDVEVTNEKNMKKQPRLASREENPRACKAAEVFFRFDSAQLGPEDDAVLQKLANEVKQYQGTTIVLDGFADPRGSESYNAILSGKRAEAVRERLISMGAPSERIVLGLHGEQGAQRHSYPEDRRVTAWVTRNTTAQIIDHQLQNNAIALVWGDQMQNLEQLAGEQVAGRDRPRDQDTTPEAQTQPDDSQLDQRQSDQFQSDQIQSDQIQSDQDQYNQGMDQGQDRDVDVDVDVNDGR